MLVEKIESIKFGEKMKTAHGTVDRIFEIHENNEKDESGQIPIIIKKQEDTGKKKKVLN